MATKKPCCAEAAARMVKKLILPDGFQVGVSNLESILKKVADLKLAGNKAIKEELLKRGKTHNYVAPAADDKYLQALLKEYKRQYGNPDKEVIR